MRNTITKFDQIGMNRQYASATKQEALIEFDCSCYACCHSPRANYRDCERCPIKTAHLYMVATLDDEQQETA